MAPPSQEGWLGKAGQEISALAPEAQDQGRETNQGTKALALLPQEASGWETELDQTEVPDTSARRSPGG